jgi:hypothetical protein
MAARKTTATTATTKEKSVVPVNLRPVEFRHMKVRIEGLNQYVQHQWDEKNKETIRKKKTGEARHKIRDKCVPEDECEAATYKLSDGRYAVPVTSIKKAMLGAAHKDYGLPKTVVAGSVFIHAEEGTLALLATPGHKMREDVVRVGNQQADLRFRPQFDKWAVDLLIEYDSETLNPELIVNLIERAGRKVGIGEGRPEKQSGLDWGRFHVVTHKEVRA